MTIFFINRLSYIDDKQKYLRCIFFCRWKILNSLLEELLSKDSKYQYKVPVSCNLSLTCSGGSLIDSKTK